MTEPLFLIAHKVRGQPAFDIAIQLPCAHCQIYKNTNGDMVQSDHRIAQEDCIECDGLGYWWIISTSGHRAYPWWELSLKFDDTGLIMDHNPEKLHWTIFEMPPSLPDHYPTRAAPNISLVDALGLRKPKVQASSTPIARRF